MNVVLSKLFNADCDNSSLKIKEKTAEAVAEIAKTGINDLTLQYLALPKLNSVSFLF